MQRNIAKQLNVAYEKNGLNTNLYNEINHVSGATT